MKEYKLPEDRLPDPIRNFIDNNPKMKYEGLYLCQSVDMDGNILDTKIGVNLMTNYGLKDRYVTGTVSMKSGAGDNMVRIWLGDSDAAIDPSSSQLTSYISALGEGSGLTWVGNDYPLEYDSTTRLWSTTYSIVQMYWDYTSGSNNEYVIKEIGMGKTRTTLWTHALIYDEHGDLSSIVKRPNTRLYVTTFITSSIKVSDIEQMYLENKFLLVSPYWSSPIGDLTALYWRPLSRGTCYRRSDERAWTYDGSLYKAYSFNRKSSETSDPREVSHSKGPGSDSTYFWQNNFYYTWGWYISSYSSPAMPDLWKDDPANKDLQCVVYFQMDTPEELESYWCYTDDTLFTLYGTTMHTSYTGTECENNNLWCIDETFGWYPSAKRRDAKTPTDWAWSGGELPCVQFDISELNLYNYISKQWDIQVPYSNQPNRVYDNSLWTRIHKDIKVTIDGTVKTVYVYCNMLPHDQYGVPMCEITSFNNSGIVICATDEYWDPSTYTQIPNLATVPAELQQKRYYIITSGNATKLNPSWTAPEGYKTHSITRKPIELTHATTGCIDQIPWYQCRTNFKTVSPFTNTAYNLLDDITLGSMPLVSTDKGFFVVAYKLFWADASWNITEYELLLEDLYPPDKFRRWMTRNEDRIIAFHTQTATNVQNHVPASSTTTLSYDKAANYFAVWTIVDDSTTPTRVELDLSTMWSDSSVVNNNTCWHRYSWSDLGYLVVAKRRTETEFVWVDIYAENGPEMHLVTNAQHAHVVERTNKVVYLDTNLTDGSTYIFQVYDMENQDIVDTITISDGTSYTINGIYGYNDHVYIRVTDTGNITYTYYYNLSSGALTRLDWDQNVFDSRYPYWCAKTIALEEDMSIISYSSNANHYTQIISADRNWDMFSDNVRNEMKRMRYFPCVAKINDGKQYLYTSTGRCQNSDTSALYSGTTIVDLGRLIDSESQQVESIPYCQYQSECRGTSSGNNVGGQVFPFNNGIIKFVGKMVSGANRYMSGRMFWMPTETCLPMHIKGTTTTLNSYNNPVEWYCDQQFEFAVTNDLSRLLPQNGG